MTRRIREHPSIICIFNHSPDLPQKNRYTNKRQQQISYDRLIYDELVELHQLLSRLLFVYRQLSYFHTAVNCIFHQHGRINSYAYDRYVIASNFFCVQNAQLRGQLNTKEKQELEISGVHDQGSTELVYRRHWRTKKKYSDQIAFVYLYSVQLLIGHNKAI